MVDKISSDMLLRQMDQIQKNMNAPEANAPAAPEGMQTENDFKNLLGKLIEDVDGAQKEADMSIKGLATGETNSIQDVVLKMEQADISFRLMKEIRDKLLQAYKDVISMQ